MILRKNTIGLLIALLASIAFPTCDGVSKRPARKAINAAINSDHETISEPPPKKVIVDDGERSATPTSAAGDAAWPGPGGIPGGPVPLIPPDDSVFDYPLLPPPIGPFSICGNGRRELFEHCDEIDPVARENNTDGCNILCEFPFCGNGILELGEECDDNGAEDGDGCSSRCQYERCGNMRIDWLSEDFREECDDGNKKPGDGCSPCCTIERCGNGILDYLEQCDDGNLKTGDGCDDWCVRETNGVTGR